MDMPNILYICRMNKDKWRNKYDKIGDFYAGRAKVRLNKKYGFVDKHGNEVTPLKYDYIGEFREGRARVRLNGKRGFIDMNGNEVIPLKYDYVECFFNERATIQIGDIWGVVDLNGKEYFSPQDRAKLRQLKIQRLLTEL
jgi:hypothetical protein